jgi:hypothetical protein
MQTDHSKTENTQVNMLNGVFLNIYLFLFYAHEYFAGMCVLMPTEVTRRHWIPGTGVTDGWELPYGCWELNPGPLEEQQVFLIAEPSLQSHQQ